MKLKLKKYPKKPKATASVAVKEAYLKKVAEINAENKRRSAETKKSAELQKKISSVGSPLSGLSSSASYGTRKRRKSVAKKKTVHKKK